MSKKRKQPVPSEQRTACSTAPPGGSGSDGTQPRRTFLRSLWIALGAVVVAELAWLVASFLKPRKQQAGDDADRIIMAGPAERFAVGSVTAFPQGRFYLARLEDGGFLALGRECTHLGCTVAWEATEHRFLCPCHASAFDIRGEVLNPPAPRALDLYAVSIENRQVKINTGRRSRRTGFDPSQAVHL